MAVVEQRKASWRLVGPGIVVAATGVGVGDLGASLLAGHRFGYALLWAILVGSIVKLALAEGTGRWHLASNKTIFDGWTSLGPWTHWFFGLYIIIWGFVYGATGMAVTGVPLNALSPVLSASVWGAIAGIVSLVLVWLNRYMIIEKIMTALVGVMFITVVGLAIYLTPDIPALIRGIAPTIPAGSTFYILGLIGGVGGTITMAAYGYWVNAKGWTSPAWLRMMRWDNAVAYITTGVFVIAMLVVSAEMLHTAQAALPEDVQADDAMAALPTILEERLGGFVSVVFLIGFFAAAFTSVVGVGHGVSLLFANYFDHLTKKGSRTVAEREKAWPFRGYLLWLTFPPMIFMFLVEKPSLLVLIYTVLGSLFMPFLALTLIWLLNSSRVAAEWRSRWVSNAALATAGLLFTVIAANEIYATLTGG